MVFAQWRVMAAALLGAFTAAAAEPDLPPLEWTRGSRFATSTVSVAPDGAVVLRERTDHPTPVGRGVLTADERARLLKLVAALADLEPAPEPPKGAMNELRGSLTVGDKSFGWLGESSSQTAVTAVVTELAAVNRRLRTPKKR